MSKQKVKTKGTIRILIRNRIVFALNNRKLMVHWWKPFLWFDKYGAVHSVGNMFCYGGYRTMVYLLESWQPTIEAINEDTKSPG